MARTRFRKIFKDIRARRGRSLLVTLSILIGVFGVTTMVSATDLLSTQLKEDLRPEAISHTHLYVTAPGTHVSPAQDAAFLDHIRQMPGVVDAEGQAVHGVAWQPAGEAGDDFENGFIVAFSEPFAQADLEPISRLTEGRYPAAGAQEIAVEQRFADATGLGVGDRLIFQNDQSQPGGKTPAWTIVGLAVHPYFTMGPSLGGQIQQQDAIFMTMDDAQAVLGRPGLSAFHVRYRDRAAAEKSLDPLAEYVINQTPYITTFTFIDDPANNFVVEIVDQFSLLLAALGVLSVVVSGFLVTNVMNSMIVEQRRQIGTMKSLGATLWDNFAIYAGIALTYGVVGTVIGVALAIPTAALMSQEIARQAFTYIEDFRISALGIGLGLVMGLLVPVMAAFLPVVNGVRISILEAMTDLGISSDWGRSSVSRAIGRLPLNQTVKQALSNIWQKKGRLALTGLTLALAVAAYMGVTSIYTVLDSFMNHNLSIFDYHVEVRPQQQQRTANMERLLLEVDGVSSVHAGYSASVSLPGFESTNPLTEGSNIVAVMGIDPAGDIINFAFEEGRGFPNENAAGVVVISSSIATEMGKAAGDNLTLMVGEATHEYTIAGVDEYAFDNIWMDWRELARITGSVDEGGNPLPGKFYVRLAGDPSIEQVGDTIDRLRAHLGANGVPATYVNQPESAEAETAQFTLFGVVFNATSLIMAVVGAIGLMAALSMAVLERQKEIGVMRSVGASSLTIMLQFLVEGVLVGVVAWVVAVPLSVGLGVGMLRILPFDYLQFAYPPLVVVSGLAGVVLVAALASLWPSYSAARRTVADILRYA